MKNLFFLCAFLFMSMQIQAQVYIVSYSVWGIPYDANGKRYYDDNGIEMHNKIVQVIIAPDGHTSYKVIWHGTRSEYKQDPKILLLQFISSALNEITAKGYTLLETSSLTSESLFFNQDQDRYIDPVGEFREPVFYLVK